jgi:hypothetical protein
VPVRFGRVGIVTARFGNSLARGEPSLPCGAGILGERGGSGHARLGIQDSDFDGAEPRLQDRCLHPRVRADGWSPPYARGLALLMHHDARKATAV